MALSFKKHYVDLILRGEKTATRRLGKPLLREGEICLIRVGFNNLPGHIRIERIYQQRLGDITEEELAREGFTSLERFKEEWQSIYGAWKDEARVWVIEFKYLKNRPGWNERFKEGD